MSDASKLGVAGRPSLSMELGRFPARLGEAMAGESNRSFGERCGLSEGVLRKYRNGETLPTLDRLEKIAVAANCNPIWLATGCGPMVPLLSQAAEAVTPYKLETDDMPLEVDHSIPEFAALAAEALKEGFDADRRLEGWEAQVLTWLRYIKLHDPELARGLYQDVVMGLARLRVRKDQR